MLCLGFTWRDLYRSRAERYSRNPGDGINRLLYAHVPFHETTHLPLGVATRNHSVDEFAMLVFRFVSFFVPKLMTGNRSSTCENIRFSITSRIFS